MTTLKLNLGSTTFMAGLAALMTLAGSARAAVINVGDYVFAPNTGIHSITIGVSGTESVAGEDFYAQIGDGGAFNGGSNAHPKFSNVDVLTGTLFSSNNVGAFGDKSPGGNAAHPLIWVDGTTTSSGTVQINPTSVLATISIDTTSAPLGKYSLLLNGVASSMGSFNTTLYDATGSPIALNVVNGSITIVPEPSFAALLGVAPLLLLARRLMRRVLMPTIG